MHAQVTLFGWVKPVSVVDIIAVFAQALLSTAQYFKCQFCFNMCIKKLRKRGQKKTGGGGKKLDFSNFSLPCLMGTWVKEDIKR